VKARRFPVILCHGLGGNRSNWNLTEDLSVPIYLSEQGFDVYLVELRGSGLSSTPSVWNDYSFNFSIDDHINYDAPALVNFVKDYTGSPQVHWVGHSMGSMVMYGYLQKFQNHGVRSLVGAGSPGIVIPATEVVELGRRMLIEFMESQTIGIPAEFLIRAGSAFAHPGWLSSMHTVWNYDNISPQVARRAAAHAVEDLSPRVLGQFFRSADVGAFVSADGEYNYTEGLRKITVPTMLMAGVMDQLAPPGSLLEVYRRIQSPEKEFHLLGKAYGFSRDYGHVDMVMGKTAPAEVFPLIADWLVRMDEADDSVLVESIGENVHVSGS